MRFYQFLLWLRFNHCATMLGTFAAETLTDLRVRGGLFAGLKYPSASAAGSVLLPKLLGTYEFEIASLLKQLLKAEYDLVVDIGCAEGYYAVGVALNSGVPVYAFDTDPSARALLKKMAEANEVTDRIVVGAGCDRAALSHLVGGRRALIISDCEGFEREIFTADIASELASSEIVIELHEHKRELFGNEIARGFADTHDATFIRSSYDIARALNTTVPELAAMNLSERVVLIAELRPVSMRWLHLSPRHRIASGAQPELARCEA